MSGLFLPALLVTVVAVGFLVAPFLIRRAPAQRRAAFDAAVYRDQLEEVDRDIARGLLDEAEAEAARVEIQRRLLAAAAEDDASAAAAETKTPNRIAALVVAVAVPLGAAAIYLGVGSPGLPDHPLSLRPDMRAAAGAPGGAPESAEEHARAERMDQMLATLAERMESDPDNLEGWSILARSYMAVGRYAEAVGAFNHAIRLSGRAPDVLSAYGEALVMVQEGGEVPQVALSVFDEVLRKDPSDFRAQFYVGLAHAQKGDLKAAFDTWLKLYQSSPEGAPWLAQVGEHLAIAAQELGIEDRLPKSIVAAPPLAPVPSIAPPPAAASPAAPGPTREQMDAAGQMSAGDRDEMIRSMVQRLADRLKENPDDRDGWLRLARAYEVLGETEKAAEAKKRAEALRK